jgi:hypothetical protein
LDFDFVEAASVRVGGGVIHSSSGHHGMGSSAAVEFSVSAMQHGFWYKETV